MMSTIGKGSAFTFSAEHELPVLKRPGKRFNPDSVAEAFQNADDFLRRRASPDAVVLGLALA